MSSNNSNEPIKNKNVFKCVLISCLAVIIVLLVVIIAILLNEPTVEQTDTPNTSNADGTSNMTSSEDETSNLVSSDSGNVSSDLTSFETISKPTDVTSQTVPQNRNAEAVNEAEKWAKTYTYEDRGSLKEFLTDPPAQQIFKSFSETEADYAIKNAKIDWKEHAQYNIKKSFYKSGAGKTPNEFVQWWRDKSSSFTQEEIEYAINNNEINWNETALDRMRKHIIESYDRGETTTSSAVTNKLKQEGFPKESITYAFDNVGMDWTINDSQPKDKPMMFSAAGEYLYHDSDWMYIYFLFLKDDGKVICQNHATGLTVVEGMWAQNGKTIIFNVKRINNSVPEEFISTLNYDGMQFFDKYYEIDDSGTLRPE